MLESILKYQEIESNILAAENELSKSKEREKAAEMQQVLKAGHSKLLSLEKTAEKVNAKYQKATEKYAEFIKKLEALEKELATADESKLALYEKAYKDFSAISNSLEKEIAAIYTEIQQINSEYEAIMKKSKTDREKFDKYKAAYNVQKAEKEPLIAGLKASLEKEKKKIDDKLFKIYAQKREGRIFPVFVALASNKCGGCRMEISASKLGAMKSNTYGVIECENCGRFIYSK